MVSTSQELLWGLNEDMSIESPAQPQLEKMLHE